MVCLNGREEQTTVLRILDGDEPFGRLEGPFHRLFKVTGSRVGHLSQNMPLWSRAWTSQIHAQPELPGTFQGLFGGSGTFQGRFRAKSWHAVLDRSIGSSPDFKEHEYQTWIVLHLSKVHWQAPAGRFGKFWPVCLEKDMVQGCQRWSPDTESG